MKTPMLNPSFVPIWSVAQLGTVTITGACTQVCYEH